jgi:hypothetical protein
MATSDFDKLWQQIQLLTDAERQALQQRLSNVPAEESLGEDSLERRLVALGVLAIPARTPASSHWQPVALAGPPISETLLQDRR